MKDADVAATAARVIGIVLVTADLLRIGWRRYRQ